MRRKITMGNNNLRVSHSQVELYNQCSYKYKLQYKDRLTPDKTFSALIFGQSLDQALNYILIRTKHNHVVYPTTAKLILLKFMENWKGANELVYFKSEAPEGIDELDPIDQQWAVWHNLISIGYMMIDTYIAEILPKFKKILSVQTKRVIPNEAGDSLVLITDFTAELQDGRVAIMDNKSSSDIKRQYGKNSVKKSQQLAIYSEFEDGRLAGYVALQKKLVDGKIAWTMVVDEVPEEMKEQAFQRVDDALNSIKAEVFPRNEKNCFMYNKRCEFWSLCKKGDTTGLVKRK